MAFVTSSPLINSEFKVELVEHGKETYVGPDAKVVGTNLFGKARVEDSAWVFDSEIFDNAVIKEDAVAEKSMLHDSVIISGWAELSLVEATGFVKVNGNAKIIKSHLWNNAQVEDYALVKSSIIQGNAHLSGKSKIIHGGVSGNGRIYDQGTANAVIVTDDSCVFGHANLEGNIIAGKQVVLTGNCKFGGTASFEGIANLDDFIYKYGKDHVEMVKNNIFLKDVWDMGS